jgi:hypothetical protein
VRGRCLARASLADSSRGNNREIAAPTGRQQNKMACRGLSRSDSVVAYASPTPFTPRQRPEPVFGRAASVSGTIGAARLVRLRRAKRADSRGAITDAQTMSKQSPLGPASPVAGLPAIRPESSTPRCAHASDPRGVIRPLLTRPHRLGPLPRLGRPRFDTRPWRRE